MEKENKAAKYRRQQILTILGKRGRIDKEELSEILEVGLDIVQEDLEHLAEQNLLSERGQSAQRLDHLPSDVGFHQRMLEREQAKKRIGEAAAQLVGDGDTLFLASGSTVYQVASHLSGKELTAVTNSLPVMSLFAKNPDIEVVSVGGVLRRSEMSFIGNFTEQTLGRLQIDKVLLGIYALSLTEGLTHSFIPETITDRAIIEAGNELIIVADHSKIGRVSATFIAPLSKIDVLVTDRDTPKESIQRLRSNGIHVIVA